MDEIDMITVKKLMHNDPMTEKEFYLKFKDTDLFKRTRAWINLKETFKREFNWLFRLLDKVLSLN